MKPLTHFAKHIIALILIAIIMFCAVYGAIDIVKELSKPKELPIIDSRTRVVYYGSKT